MSWNFLRYTQPVVRNMIFPAAQKIKKIPDAELTFHDAKGEIKVGRSWRVSELRLKSYDDLQKLWYVLLKEKLALKSDEYYCKKMNQKFAHKSNYSKVVISMARLKSVISERKILIGKFTELLEDQYIAECKEKEKMENAEKNANKEKKRKEKREIPEPLVGNTEELAKKSVLNIDEIDFIKHIEKQAPQKDLLKRYVKNWKELRPRERRIALGKINAARSDQAKEILMKEMYAIKRKLDLAPPESKETAQIKEKLSNIS